MAEIYQKNHDTIDRKTYQHDMRTMEASVSHPLSPGLDINVPNLRDQIKVRRLNLSRREIISLVFSAIICMLILVTHLFLQYNNSRTLQAINNYNASTSELQRQTNQMNEEITKQFNYLEIKATALEEGMTLDKSRIRTVEE